MYSSIYVGRVLNRFSKDIGFVDAALPYEFVDFLTVSIENNWNVYSYIIHVSLCVL